MKNYMIKLIQRFPKNKNSQDEGQSKSKENSLEINIQIWYFGHIKRLENPHNFKT
jgi:hypothetical protein